MSEKYVLFLDILGFKDLIERNNPKEVEEVYKENVIKSYGPAMAVASAFGNNIQTIKFDVKNHMLVDTKQDLFNFHIMSDSIIIWTNDTNAKTLAQLFAFSGAYIKLTFDLGVPLRGAISKGVISEMITPMNGVSQTCYMGTGIVNAYQLEGKQNWMGCIVDMACISDIPPQALEEIKSNKQSFITEYLIPTKTGYEEGFVINWPNAQSTFFENSIDNFESKFSKFNKDISKEKVKIIIKNTFDFYQDKIVD